MLAPGISTEPPSPLSHVANVTTVGRWMAPSTIDVNALARRSPETTSSTPGAGCSTMPYESSSTLRSSPPCARMCTCVYWFSEHSRSTSSKLALRRIVKVSSYSSRRPSGDIRTFCRDSRMYGLTASMSDRRWDSNGTPSCSGSDEMKRMRGKAGHCTRAADTSRVRRVITTGVRDCSESQLSPHVDGPIGTLASSNGRIASSEAESTRRRFTSVSGPAASPFRAPGSLGTAPRILAISTPMSRRIGPRSFASDAVSRMVRTRRRNASCSNGTVTTPASPPSQMPRYGVSGDRSWLCDGPVRNSSTFTPRICRLVRIVTLSLLEKAAAPQPPGHACG
jgi:hypothetical protein